MDNRKNKKKIQVLKELLNKRRKKEIRPKFDAVIVSSMALSRKADNATKENIGLQRLI